ncbi:putative transposase [Lachnospiraceae bacterium NLAE-zl-G231]|nr:putative transposase [Lachnospiraceae bacterium NLAE-zl-G231]
MDSCTHEVRFNQWKLIIAQCQSRPEGQTAKQWMAENGVPEKSYYYWLRKVCREVYGQSRSGCVPLPAIQEKETVTFSEIFMSPHRNTKCSFPFQPAVVIKTSSATVAVANEVSDRLLERILQEVSHA